MRLKNGLIKPDFLIIMIPKMDYLKKILLGSFLLILSMNFGFAQGNIGDTDSNAMLERAKEGDAVSQYKIGKLYQDKGASWDVLEAGFSWLKKSADQGNVEAMTALGWAYVGGIGVQEDWAAARELFEKAAKKGNADAETYLGWFYDAGEVVDKDREMAKRLYNSALKKGNQFAAKRLADLDNPASLTPDKVQEFQNDLRQAERGDRRGQVNVGVDYLLGIGVAPDVKKAEKWFKKALDQGSTTASYNLGWLYYEAPKGIKRNYEEAVRLLTVAAKAGEDCAQQMLGICYLLGRGTIKNPTEAVNWLRKAVNQGERFAQYQLGECYLNGWGTERNVDEAFALFKKSAEKNTTRSLYLMGYCYEKGLGVPSNLENALEWYRKAAQHGVLPAMASLDRLKGLTAVYDDARLGNVNAERIMGLNYYSGDILGQNYAEAAKWFREGADKNDPVSLMGLAHLYEEGKGVQKDMLQAGVLSKRLLDLEDEDTKDAAAVIYSSAVKELAQLDGNEASALFHVAAEMGDERAMRLYVASQKGKSNFKAAIPYMKVLAQKEDGVPYMKMLGKAYETGDGVAKSPSMAASFYRKAADLGDAESKLDLALLYWEGNGVEQSDKEAKLLCVQAVSMGLERAKSIYKDMQCWTATGPVDLGLSVKWAACNLGASNPQEYGKFFYEEVDSDEIGLDVSLEDDIARSELGGKWRLPTEKEFRELMFKCRWKWTRQRNGIYGYQIISSVNGNFIFLPACGRIEITEYETVNQRGVVLDRSWEERAIERGEIGFYFTSTSDKSAPGRSLFYLLITKDGHILVSETDSGSACVRPVCD